MRALCVSWTWVQVTSGAPPGAPKMALSGGYVAQFRASEGPSSPSSPSHDFQSRGRKLAEIRGFLMTPRSATETVENWPSERGTFGTEHRRLAKKTPLKRQAAHRDRFNLSTHVIRQYRREPSTQRWTRAGTCELGCIPARQSPDSSCKKRSTGQSGPLLPIRARCSSRTGSRRASGHHGRS